MKVETVLFDLDGTLIKMDVDNFEKAYIGSLSQAVSSVIEPKKFVEALWKSTHKMVKNDGSKTNETLFYETFAALAGEEYLEPLAPILDEYYAYGFEAASVAIDSSEEMIKAVKLLKEKGYRVIIATNPMFPQMAVRKRIEWAGLKWEDFEHVTHFEICHYCKPNPLYYQEIVDVRGLNPKTCLMVGNDAQEDLAARDIGMQTFLVEDELIDRGLPFETEYRGTRKDFLKFVENL